MEIRKQVFGIAAVVLGLIAVATGAPEVPAKPITASEAGAVRYTVEIVVGKGEEISEKLKLETIEVLSKRLAGSASSKNVKIESKGKTDLIVTVLAEPGKITEKKLAAWRKAISQQGELSFHMAHPDHAASPNPKKLPAGTVWLPRVKSDKADAEPGMIVFKKPEIEGEQVRYARASKTFGERWSIMLILNRKGAELFFELSKEHQVQGGTGLPVALVIDGEIVFAPVFNEPIPGGNVMISGDFTKDEASAVGIRIQDPLPAQLKILSREFLEPKKAK